MGIKICGAPCCWGVDDITNPNLPTYQRVMSEAHEAGYRAIELGPNGWIPTDDIESVTKLLNDNQLLQAQSLMTASAMKIMKSCWHRQKVSAS